MLKMSHVYFAWKQFWREWRAGNGIILFFALFFSIVTVTSLDFLAQRIKLSIYQQSNRFLGGDLALISSHLIPDDWKKQAAQLGLKYAEVWTYPSMITVHDQFQLTTIQAVSDTYPILNQSSYKLLNNTVWVEPRLLNALHIKINDQLSIGDKSFIVAQALTSDKDILNTGFGFMIAPRLMMRISDVAATKTIMPGSRVEYRLLLAGELNALKKFQQKITPALLPGQRLVTVRQQQHYLRYTLERAENYLQLVLLVCMIISSVVIALSMMQFVRRYYATVALWRCLGMRRQTLLIIFLWQLLLSAVLAGIAGVVVGYGIQWWIASFVQPLLPLQLAKTSLLPALKGLMLSILLLAAFAYPIIVELPNINPIHLWRRDVKQGKFFSLNYLLSMIFIFAIILYVMVDLNLLTLLFLDLILLSIAILYGVYLLLLNITQRVLPLTKGAIRRGLNNLLQHADLSSLPFVGLTLIIWCFFILGFIRSSLIEQWQQDLPINTPNYFIFNIAPQDIPSLSIAFKRQQISLIDFYPMVRGRLTQLNGIPIMRAIPASARGHNALHRELNLSSMWQYPADNQIIFGRAFAQTDKGQAVASLELKMAQALHIQLGDIVTFRVGEQEIKAKIINLRRLRWESFHPNFYVIFPPGFLPDLPTTYITSVHLMPEQVNFLNTLVKRYPNMTIVDVADMVEQIKHFVAKITFAIQLLFLFSLGSGLLIMLLAFQASLAERRKTWRLLHILGASQAFIRKSVRVELSYLLLLMLGVAFLLAKAAMYWLDPFKTFS